MGAPLTRQNIVDFTNRLYNLSVNSDIQQMIEQQGDIKKLNTRMNQMKDETRTLNREFSERFEKTDGKYKLPFFGTNQDIFLSMFYFSYVFLVLVSLVTVYKNTGSWQKVAYGLIGSFFLILIITGVLLRIA